MSFLTPLGLLLGLLAGPLLALYFLKLRRRRVKVPSTLLWAAFQRSERLASPFQRFRRNLLLLLQLLALLLLALAFARPYVQAEAESVRSVVLVVDTSASMGATDVAPHRLGAALAEADRLLDRVGTGDEVMVVAAGPTTEVVVPFTRDLGAARAALARLAPTEAEASLRDGLQLALSLARSRQDVEIVVLSDGGNQALTDLPTGGARVRLVPVGRSGTNAGILAVDLRASPSSDLDRQLFVTVRNFGPDEVEGTVEVYLEERLVGLRTQALPTDGPASFVFAVPGGTSGVLRVALDSPGDQLEADDVAYAVARPVHARSVLLVGGDALTARALAADPRVDLSVVAPGDATAERLAGVDAAVFAGSVPSAAEGVDRLILAPSAGSPATFGDEVRGPGVLGWRRTHPVLRFVEWDGVVVARARKVVDSGGLVSLVDGTEGPLLLAGEVGGARVVQLAFDPLQSDLPLRVGWPVLLLNAVGWLTEDGAGGGIGTAVATGTPFVRRLPDGLASGEVEVSGPDGRASASVEDGLLRVRSTERVGVYRVRAGGVETAFAANLVSERESEIAPRSALELGDAAIDAQQAALVGRRELWRPLAWLALALLLVEWGAWHRRRSA